MVNQELRNAVLEFTTLMLPLSEKDLEREWKWKDHDEEGIRFAFFVTLQELRHLAVTLSNDLNHSKPTAARHILSQYHSAYLDLQAAILGVSDDDAERAPAEGEWTVKRTYAHIFGTDINFSIAIRYALEKHRAKNWIPEKMSDEEADRLAGISDEKYIALTNGPLSDMVDFHRRLHEGILEEFSSVTDQELELPSTFWEDTRFPIQHRLHRYEAHFVQHTIQIDKTLAAIGLHPPETKLLLRKIFSALAEVEGILLDIESKDDSAIFTTASSIAERVREIRDLL
jgi:hypothetical protein